MSRLHHYPPHDRGPQEQQLRELVDLLVQDDPQKPAYLAFARELVRSIHRPPVPDFERGTKRVVMRWFERGLHGRMLWLIGQAVIQKRLW